MIRADRIEDETGLSLDVNMWEWGEYENRVTGEAAQAVRAPELIRLVPTDIVEETVEIPAGHWLVEFPDGAFEVLRPTSFHRKYCKDE